MTAQNVMSVPTDRSMPPVMMTKVQATASTPLTAVDCRMPTMLSVCMKLGDAMLKKTINPIRLANASSFCRVLGLKMTSLSRRSTVESDLGGVSFMFICDVRWRCRSSMHCAARRGLTLGRQLHDLLLGRALSCQLAGNAAFAHHQNAAAHAQHLGQLGPNHHDGAPLLGQRMQRLVNLAFGAHIDAARGFIEEENFAIPHQPFGNHDFLLVAAR